MLVGVGTNNKAKVTAVENIVGDQFPQAKFKAISVASNVSEQPMTDEETRLGAINRALNTRETLGTELSIGLEGGVREIAGQMYCCNWGALVLADGTILTAAGALFVLPEEVASQIRVGAELGPVMDVFTKQHDTRQHAGAIGVFTNGLINRKEMFDHIVKLLVGQYLYHQSKYN